MGEAWGEVPCLWIQKLFLVVGHCECRGSLVKRDKGVCGREGTYMGSVC